MGNFIKKCTSMLLLVSILCTTVFPNSFASYANEINGNQDSNIDRVHNDVPLDAQNMSDKSAEKAEEIAGAVFKAVALDTQTLPLGEEEKIVDRLKIKDIVLDTLGEDLPGMDGTKETIVMRLGYDGEASLDNIIKTRITQILIDEVSYALEEEGNGYKNFFLFEGKKLGIAAAYPEGERAVGDFKKRELHKVEITFDDGSVAQYQDPGYTPRNFDTDPAPPPVTKKPKPPVQMVRKVKGYLVKTDNKKAKSTANDALIHEITTKASDVNAMGQQFIDIPLKFNEVSVHGATGQVKSISYETMPGNNREAKKAEDGAFLIAYPPRFLENTNSTKDNEINVDYVIEIAGKAPVKESAILILDWNNDFRFEGEDVQPPSPQPKDGIGNKYSIKEATVENGDLKITLNQNFDKAKHEREIKRLVINGKSFEMSKNEMALSGSYIREKELTDSTPGVVAQAKKHLNELEIEIWFNDDSVLKYKKDGGPVQPPQEDEKEREVKGYMLEEGEQKVSPANKAIREIKVKPIKSTETQGKKFYEVVIRLGAVSIGEDTVGIKTFLYNKEGEAKIDAEPVADSMYDSYKMLIPAEKIQPKGSETDTKIKVQYTLKTEKAGYNQPFDAILLLDWNDDFDEPGNFAKKFEIKGVEVKDDPKEVRVTLNNGLLNSQLGLVKQVKVNDDTFAVQASDLAQAGDNKVLIIKKQDFVTKAKEKATTGWTLTVIFNDDSKLEYYVKKQAQPTPPPVQPGGEIAKKYKIKEILTDQGWNKKQVHFVFEPKLNPTEAHGIKKVEINGTVFENNPKIFFPNSDRNLETTNEGVTAAIKAQKSIAVKITFADNSVLTYGTVTPPAPSDTIASKNEITSVGFGTGYSANDLQIAFKGITGIVDSVALHKQIKTIEVNGTSFAASIFKGSYDGYITTSDEGVATAARSKTPIVVKVTFTDDSVLTNTGDSTPTPPPQPPQPPQEGEAKGHVIELMKAKKEEKEFWIFFEKDISPFWNHKITKIQLDGQDFEMKSTDLVVSGKSIKITRQDILDKVFAVQNIDAMGIVISFNDGSQIKKNVVDVPKVPDIKIGDELKEGTYTLTYQAYKAGSTTEISTFGGFFDVRAKLVVSGNTKTITLLNHTAADLMLDFAIKTNGQFASIKPTNITHGFKGEKSSAEYTFDVSDLTGRHVVAILGSGPMGGNQGEVGQFDNENYKKAEIVFNEEVIKGWTDFKFPEDVKKNAQEGHKRLVEGLIKNNVDTNQDGQISEQELRDATGIRTLVAGEMRNNVIDLEGVKTDDISMLKHLGPKVKVLNINGSKIKDLPQDVFQNATGLQAIYLGGNEIREIKPGTFDKLVNLDYIDFDGNRLGALPEGIFDKNVELESVSFMNSGVTSVPAGMLRNLSSLKYLYLQENSLTEIPDEFFAGSKNLVEAHLHHNKLTSLPSSLGNLRKLKLINAQHNEIKRVPESFGQLKRLETLDLESNRVEYIPTALYTNMVKLASITQVRLDLSMNNLRELPVEEMIGALESGGGMLTKFEVNKNYLSPVVNKEDESKMKRLGVDFEKNKESYYPQKGSIASTLTISGGNIQLAQEFDILELYYWDQGDSAYYGGKEEFKTKEEFLKYLLGEGRDYHKVDRSLDRDVAIQEILNKKSVKWEVETIIMKNGQELSKTISKNNAKEGLNQTFQDPSMKAGDNYTLIKKLHIKGVFGWALALEYTVEGTATGNAQPPNQNPNEKTVKVQIHKFGTEEASVANQAINPNAKIVNKEGKFEYTVEFKPLVVQNINGNIIKFSVKIKGQLKEIAAQPAKTPGYTSSYTFTLDEEVTKLDVEFEADVMNGFIGGKPNPQKAHLVFGDEIVQPQPKKDRMIKAYILKENEDKPSMANKA
ncbi:MAG: NEAT domain-containing protein, partial [Peptostreptococcaceae bacterium]|nr:NEAT domain-containing protein [Peptostreptococcaceae bacterium]